jgi:hypothetical protein
LIALGGERLSIDGSPAISGGCHTSGTSWQKALPRASGSSCEILAEDGLVSWLHIGNANHRAIELYSRMGFKEVRKVTLNRISRKG